VLFWCVLFYNQESWTLLYVFTGCLYLFENSLFNSCAYFFTGVLILWGLSFLGSLQILDTSLLLNEYLTKIFSHSVGWKDSFYIQLTNQSRIVIGNACIKHWSLMKLKSFQLNLMGFLYSEVCIKLLSQPFSRVQCSGFSTFTWLCDHHHHPFQNFFIMPH
jgi:hypothetical protein